MQERTYTVTVQVQDADANLLDESVPLAIRQRFSGTAVRVIECEPVPGAEKPWWIDHMKSPVE